MLKQLGWMDSKHLPPSWATDGVVFGCMLALILALTLTLLLVLGAVLLERRKNKRVDRQWKELAEQMDGRFSPRGGWFLKPKARRIEDAAGYPGLVLDHYLVNTGNAAQDVTRLQKRAVGAGPLKLKVARKNFMSRLATVVGFQDVATGDSVFDEAFVVKCNDPARAKVWLSAEVRQTLLAVEDYAFELADGELKATRYGLDEDTERLLCAAQAMLLFAQAGERLRAQWQAFAETKQGEVAASEEAYDLQQNGIAIRVVQGDEKAGLLRRQAFTELRAKRVGASRERFVVSEQSESDGLEDVRLSDAPTRYRVASSEPTATARRLDPVLLQRLDEVAPSLLQSDEDYVTMRIEGADFDAERMQEAVEILAELAQNPQRDAYRS
jgi:hypothetical protein